MVLSQVKSGKIISLCVLAQILFLNPCFADPSEFLLKRLSRNAVDFRRNGLPSLLSEGTRTESMNRVAKATLDDLATENYEGLNHDRAILNCMLRSDSWVPSKDCDLLEILTTNLLFAGGESSPHRFSQVGIPNPSYEIAVTKYPEMTLMHDTFKDQLIRILESKRIGKTNAEHWRAVPSTEKDQAIFRDHFSLPLNSYGLLFLGCSPSRADLDKYSFYNSAGIRLIFKKDVLKRWDFHISNDHNGGNFLKEEDRKSFGPAELDEFMQQQEKKLDKKSAERPEVSRETLRSWYSPEFVFYNAISIGDIEEIVVSHYGEKAVRELLQNHHADIKVTPIDNELGGRFGSTNSLEESKQQIQETIDLERVLKKIQSNPSMLHDFECFDSNTRMNTKQKLQEAIRCGDHRLVDPDCSKTLWDYQKSGKSTLKSLEKQQDRSSEYNELYNRTFPQKDGEFAEPWMKTEATKFRAPS